MATMLDDIDDIIVIIEKYGVCCCGHCPIMTEDCFDCRYISTPFGPFCFINKINLYVETKGYV